MNSFYIDFHCHPALKSYGKSFNDHPIGVHSPNVHDKNSAWYYDAPDLFDRGIQLFTGISKFTQADFSTLSFGNARLICASLYPIERGFFKNNLGQSIVSDVVDNFITGVGRARVNSVQGMVNYFEDLQREYDFYKQLHDQWVNTVSGRFKYILVRNYAEIEKYNGHPDQEHLIFVIISIEGMHVLNPDIDKTPVESEFLDHVAAIKRWEYPPLFVTFSHHFYNELCGHARSLTGIVGKATDQSHGLGTGFTPLGRKVLEALLSKQNGSRVFIDIKHLSAQGRKEYLKILEDNYANENIPVIVSHGAANGLRSMDNKVMDSTPTAHKLLQEDINFYDEEILAVARSKGIFGLQLDERRIANAQTLKDVKHSLFMNKIRHYRAELLWNQVQHIAELLDRNNLPAWDCMAIGSDFDGIINPLNGFLTAETFVHLEEYLERYAYNYMQDAGKKLQSYNQISADKIVHRIFHSNGLDFLQRVF
jgi:microsomal dipeptidase-like Zn-dependent dipeptidase